LKRKLYVPDTRAVPPTKVSFPSPLVRRAVLYSVIDFTRSLLRLTLALDPISNIVKSKQQPLWIGADPIKLYGR
jgi:hypothetical protein